MAILLVVLCHSDNPLFREGGTVGVTLFFVLSGYLITTILVNEQRRFGEVSLAKFYQRRFLRLLPAVLVAVCLGSAMLIVTRVAPASFVLKGGAASLFYLADLNTWLHIPLSGFGHYWSLSLEEQFYVVWPLVLVWVMRRRQPSSRYTATMVVLAVVAAVSVGFRILAGAQHGWTLPFTPQSNAFGLLVGCIGALWVRSGRPMPSWRWATAAFALVVAVAVIPGLRTGIHADGSRTGLIIQILASPAVVIPALVVVLGVVAFPDRSRLLTHPLLRHAGTISYGWYVWHGPLIAIVEKLSHTSSGGGSIRAIAVRTFGALVALGFAELSYHFVEKPFLRRKVKLERSTIE